jgi:hypothetical protein
MPSSTCPLAPNGRIVDPLSLDSGCPGAVSSGRQGEELWLSTFSEIIDSTQQRESGVGSWRVNPFLHVDGGSLYNPLTHRTLTGSESDFLLVESVAKGFEIAAADAERLALSGWIGRDDELARGDGFYLRIVSLETTTVCNQKCYFCPVSVDPREAYEMPDALFTRIVGELAPYRKTLEAVFLQSYNEPTLDRRFLDQVRELYAAGLPVAVLSNATGLTPARVDGLLGLGQLRLLTINLSTLDREKYIRDRGEDHLPRVLRNLDYLKTQPVAADMKIVVLGTGDESHRQDFEAIRDRFAGSHFRVERHEVMDRAGWLEIGAHPAVPNQRLAGCDNVGSRPIQHLHITPHGKCVLCCEDYDENYVVGDLAATSVAGVLVGPELARMRRWIYGLEEAPADFICRSCVFARTR